MCWETALIVSTRCGRTRQHDITLDLRLLTAPSFFNGFWVQAAKLFECTFWWERGDLSLKKEKHSPYHLMDNFHLCVNFLNFFHTKTFTLVLLFILLPDSAMLIIKHSYKVLKRKKFRLTFHCAPYIEHFSRFSKERIS